MFKKKSPTIKKVIGLRNIVTTKDKWSYLLFYDLDNPSELDIHNLIGELEEMQTSYIMYETKHGVHAVGLTPMDSYDWGLYFSILQYEIPEYYSGQTIRVSLKEGESRSLIFWNLEHPVIWRLFKMYEKRFPQLKNHSMDYQEEINNYSCVFEKYWSRKV